MNTNDMTTNEQAGGEPTANEYPYFGSLFVAVFNCSKYEQRCGRRAVMSQFGAEGWNEVRNNSKTGIMEIFNHKPTPATKLYAETIGKMADKRAMRLVPALAESRKEGR